jgi:hypothetical protein
MNKVTHLCRLSDTSFVTLTICNLMGRSLPAFTSIRKIREIHVASWEASESMQTIWQCTPRTRCFGTSI